jgi:DNA-binding NarL/FixJ family response regulator
MRTMDSAGGPHGGPGGTADGDLAADVARVVADRGRDAAQLLVRSLRRHCGVEHAAIASVDPTIGWCSVVAVAGPDVLTVGTSSSAELSTRLSRAVRGRVWASSDFGREAEYRRVLDQMAKVIGFRSGCSVPIMAGGGAVGAVLLSSTAPDRNWARVVPMVEAVNPLIGLGLGLGGRDRGPLRVLVLHPDQLVGHGLARFVEQGLAADLVVSHGAADPVLRRHLAEADVVVTDEDAAGLTVRGATRSILELGGRARVVVVAGADNASIRASAVAAGADSVVAHRYAQWELIAAIARAAGRPPAAASATVGRSAPPSSALQVPGLTVRESQLLRELRTGIPYKRIAAHMGLSVTTVRGYSRGLYAKLDVHSRGEAVHEAVRRGLLGPV